MPASNSGDFALQISWEFCGSQMLESHGISRHVIVADAKLDVDLPDLPTCFSSPENLPSCGLWYRIVGTGNLMSVQLDSKLLDLSGTRLSVFLGGSGCSNLFCVVTDCIVDTTCGWESTADQQLYYVFITFIHLTSSFTEFWALLQEATILLTIGERIFINDSCNNTFQISPGRGNSLFGSFLSGSTSDVATFDTGAPSCGSASNITFPGA
jgi:hypothetical protein